jgi:hypothetical protein
LLERELEKEMRWGVEGHVDIGCEIEGQELVRLENDGRQKRQGRKAGRDVNAGIGSIGIIFRHRFLKRDSRTSRMESEASSYWGHQSLCTKQGQRWGLIEVQAFLA